MFAHANVRKPGMSMLRHKASPLTAAGEGAATPSGVWVPSLFLLLVIPSGPEISQCY